MHMTYLKKYISKRELWTGNLIVLRNGDKAIIALNNEGDRVGLLDNGLFVCIDSYNSYLNGVVGDLDIVKVYGRPSQTCNLFNYSTSERRLLWERPLINEVRELTMEEVCQALGYEVKIKK